MTLRPGSFGRGAVLSALLGSVSCSGGTTLVSPEEVGQAFAFARQLDQAAVLVLPDSSQPDDAEIPDRAPIQGPFKLLRTVDGVQEYEAPIPVRPRSLFFSVAPRGMKLYGPTATGDGARPLNFKRRSSKAPQANTWAYAQRSVFLRVPEAQGEPEDGQYSLEYPRAVEREQALNLSSAGVPSEQFASPSLQLGQDTRTGLFLPAPAEAAWDLTLPTAALLELDAVIMPPELALGPVSDGATLVIELHQGDERVELLRQPLEVGEWEPVKLDLSARAGEQVRIGFRTEAGDSSALDYVFLAEPVVYSPSREPQRLLLVFLDTLRPDHMGMYGYERPTTPKLDAWAKDAVVFENARSVAPWTLPSTRSVLSGRHPELWETGPTLPEILSEAGWATGAFVGNVYLSSNFGMAQGWSQYGVQNWPQAGTQVDKVEDFVDRHPHQDLAVMLHTMDMHLPYTEPRKYRRMWAGDSPEGMSERAARSEVLKAARKDKEGVRQHLIDRYDQNLKYLDDQVTRALEIMGPNTTVVLFADHGEEFWDHGGFEHGHTLYDELLRVPLVVKSPSIEGARRAAPVSLLDITPTVLELLELPAESVQGHSLVPLMQGQAGADQALLERPQAVGRPLYGDERWGVIDGDSKWTTYRGEQSLYDLAADPEETDNLANTPDAPLSELRGAMGESLRVDAPVTWRISAPRLTKTPRKAQVLELSHPLGIREAWLGGDPLRSANMSLEGPDDDGVVRVTFNPGSKGFREVYLRPGGPVEQLDGLTLRSGDDCERVNGVEVVPKGRKSPTLFSARKAGRSLKVNLGYAPVPGEGMALEGTDDELQSSLEAMGYMEHEEEGSPPEEPKEAPINVNYRGCDDPVEPAEAP